MIKRITQSAICLVVILLMIFLSSCEQLTRENNREPESAPKDFTVTSSIYGEVSLKWSAVIGATEYEIFYSTDDDSSNAISLISTNLTNFNAELTSGELYYFWITAKNGTATSSYSSMESVIVESSLPAPTGLVVTSGSYGEVSLTWNVVRQATSYEIFYSINPDFSTASSFSTNLTKFDASLTPDVLYYFWVKAKANTATSDSSSIESVTILNTLSAPQGFSATSNTYGKVSFTWTAVKKATEYEVFYSKVADSSNATILGSTNLTNFSSTLTPSEKYYFWVTAKNSTTTSGFSSGAIVTIDNTLPAIFAPTGLEATSTSYGKVSLKWNVVTKANLYEVFYSENPDSSSAISLTSTDLTNFDTELTPSVIYYFWVKAKNSTATSDFSDMASVTIKTLSAPTDFSATSSTYGKVSLAWDVVDDATSYEIFYSANPDSSNVSSLGTTELLKIDADLTAGASYYFWVKAKNDTATSPFSSVARAEISKSLIETVLVEGGTFLRAGGFEITVSSFYMGTYEVTQKQWLDMTGKNPSYNKPTTGWYEYPVENISWYDAVEFCNMLSKTEELEPAYVIDKEDPTDQSYWTVTCDFTKNGYRLPTEAEWEYAANGGTHNSNFTYSGSDTIGDVAWWYFSGGKTHEVGGKKANALGVYDMSGNVAEWCWDRNGDYPNESLTNPTGAMTGVSRVYRGGYYSSYYASDCRVVTRSTQTPNSGKIINGFRVVRSILPR